MKKIENPVGKLLIKDNKNIWQYDSRFIDWLKNNSKNFSSEFELSKFLTTYYGFIKKVAKINNINLEYTYKLNNAKFKAIYQSYDWCYQKYIDEGLNHDEMALEANCSKRVVEKWCSEIHKLTQKFRQKEKQLSILQKDLIIGSMLGDGHIDKRETQPIFIVSHAENQKDYLYYKYKILKDMCNIEPREIEEGICVFKEKQYNHQKQYRLCTRIYDCLKEYRNKSYTYLLNQLNEYSFSIWMLDDAYRGYSNWSLCVAEYTQEDVNNAINILKERFNLNCWQGKDIRYLQFDAECSRNIDLIILRNIPNEFDIIKYKITENENISNEVKKIYVNYNNRDILLSDLCKTYNLNYKHIHQKLFRDNKNINEIMEDVI